MADTSGKTLESLTSDRDILDRLMSKIPGFRGYVEYTEHYNADRIVRMHISRMLATIKEDLVRIQNGFVTAGNLQKVTECESISLSIEKIIKKIEAADFGGSSSFSHNKVKLTAASQENILSSDNNVLIKIEELQKNTAAASDGSSSIFDTGAFITLVRDIDRLFDERIKIITGE